MILDYTPPDPERLAALLQLLAEPNRLRIFLSLVRECRSVGDIAITAGLTQSNTSFHLRILREAGLVRPERRGPFIYYCLYDLVLPRLLGGLDGWVSQRLLRQNSVKAK